MSEHYSSYSPKNELAEWYQKQFRSNAHLPTYNTYQMDGRWKCIVTLPTGTRYFGAGPQKKVAEQEAAYIAICALRQVDETAPRSPVIFVDHRSNDSPPEQVTGTVGLFFYQFSTPERPFCFSPIQNTECSFQQCMSERLFHIFRQKHYPPAVHLVYDADHDYVSWFESYVKMHGVSFYHYSKK